MGFFDKLTGSTAEKKSEEKKTPKPTTKEPTNQQEEAPQKNGQLALDIYETDNEFIIHSTAAGVKPEELDVSIDGDLVSIKGSRKRTIEEKQGKYIYQECYWGEFSREIILPEEVNETKTEATIKNGVLTLRIPKTQKSKKTKVTVTPIE